MNNQGWSGRIITRYTLLQLPALALLILVMIFIKRWVIIPSWIFWSAISFWIAKDALLFPFVWRAYDWDETEKKGPMIGAKGIAQERLAPSGYVFARGTLWQAEVVRGGPPIEKGSTVRVQRVDGIKIFVEPHTPIE